MLARHPGQRGVDLSKAVRSRRVSTTLRHSF
jgi:hypothetical protein